jgi:hypothetical protein
MGNASFSEEDKNTRFREISPNGGAIGETRIFLVRDADGKAGRAGYVVKAASWRDNMGEVLSQYLMVEEGLPVEGAGWDGKLVDGDDAVVLPHAANRLPEGNVKLGHGQRNFHPDAFNDQLNQGFDRRLTHLMHNYLMKVNDRHKGNGLVATVKGEKWAIPIDQGWAGRAAYQDFNDYADKEFGMDAGLPGKMKAGLASEDGARAVVAAYDEMIERAQRVIDGGFEGVWMKVKPPTENNRQREHAESLFRIYGEGVKHLKERRAAILARMIPDQYMGVV